VILLGLALGFTGALMVAILRFVDEPSIMLAAVIPVVVALAVGAFVIPVHMIPALVVAAIALVPTRFIPGASPFNALPALALVMGVWVFRRVVLAQTPKGAELLPPLTRVGPRLAVYATGVLLAAWIAFSMLRAGLTDTTIGWSTAFIVSVLLPLVVFDARIEMRLMRTVLLVVGAITGANIVLQLVTNGPALYGLLSVGGDFSFHVFRPQGPFNHPLFAGAFLTIPALIGIGQWLTTGKWWPLLAGLTAAAGVVSTVSRSSIGAVGIALGVAVVVAPFFLGWAHLKRWFLLVALGAVGAIAVLNFQPLIDRSSSLESELSAGVREQAVPLALSAAQYAHWMGTGPGTSGETARLFGTIIIENSMLQLIISLGIPGLILFVAFLGSLIWCAWARGDLGVGLAVIGYTVAITGFNSLDAVRNMHILIGLLVLLAVHSSTSPRLSESAPTELLDVSRFDTALAGTARRDPAPAETARLVSAPFHERAVDRVTV
jgi:hypothetical protein